MHHWTAFTFLLVFRLKSFPVTRSRNEQTNSKQFWSFGPDCRIFSSIVANNEFAFCCTIWESAEKDHRVSLRFSSYFCLKSFCIGLTFCSDISESSQTHHRIAHSFLFNFCLKRFLPSRLRNEQINCKQFRSFEPDCRIFSLIIDNIDFTFSSTASESSETHHWLVHSFLLIFCL